MIIYIDNTGVVELNGLKNGQTGAFIDDASVECTLYHKNDVVDGQTFPVTLDYVAASDGIYRGLLSSALELDEDETYTARISATGDGLEGTWNCKVVAKERACGSETC